MSEEQPAQNSTPEDGVDQNPGTPEVVVRSKSEVESSPSSDIAMGELALGHEEQASKIEDLERTIADLKARLEAVESQIQKPESPVESSPAKSPEDTEHHQDNPDPTDTEKRQPGIKARRQDSIKDRLIPGQADDRLEVALSQIEQYQKAIDEKKANGEDTTDLEVLLKGAEEQRDFLQTQPYIDSSGNLHDPNTGRFMVDNNRYWDTDRPTAGTLEGDTPPVS